MKRAEQLQRPLARRHAISNDGVLVVRSGPADQATEDAIERWLLSLLERPGTPDKAPK